MDFARLLYERLASDDSDAAHSRYNALLRRQTAFESALEHAAGSSEGR